MVVLGGGAFSYERGTPVCQCVVVCSVWWCVVVYSVWWCVVVYSVWWCVPMYSAIELG